ncbi:MAG: DUF2283 domain-containing protein [Chloroflexota bacterium]
MSVKIGNLTFDHVSYDATGDVLYLHVGEPQPAADAEETAEGHVLRYDKSGRIVGLTIVNARWLVERDGVITVTMPQPQLRASASDLAGALGLAS